MFAAITMAMIGGWWIIAGLVGLINNNFCVATRNYVFKFDSTAWGWIHLITGIVVLISAFGLFTGAVWARTVGVIMAIWTMLPGYPGTRPGRSSSSPSRSPSFGR